MRVFRNECPGLYGRVEAYARSAFSAPATDAVNLDFAHLSFSDLCTFLEFQELREYGGGERWSDAGSREKLALKFYLAKVIAASTPGPRAVPDLYRQFAAQLRSTDIVISFNWDCLLENALQAAAKAFRYLSMRMDDVDPSTPVSLAKLHGSVNWRLGAPRRRTLDWTDFAFTSGMMTEEVYSSSLLQVADSWLGTEPLEEVQPLIVLPGAGKAFDIRPLAPLWYKPEFAFAFTHDVFIIGLSLTPDDFFIRSFFLANLPYAGDYTGIPGRRITIINPDPGVRVNYSFLLGQSDVEFLCEPFSASHFRRFTGQ
jgi:hypothetical protein